MKISYTLTIIAVVCGLAAGTARAGSEAIQTARSGGGSSRVIINRSPNFGTQQPFNLYIDGVRVATLGYNRSYDGVVSAGEHVVTIQQVPHLNDAYPFTDTRIHLTPGSTAVFTAVWRNGGTRAVVERS